MKNVSYLASDNTKCSAACQIRTFEVQSTMASISDIDLEDQADNISRKFQHSMEIKGRAEAEMFIKTAKSLVLVVDTLKAYTREIERQSGLGKRSGYNTIYETLSIWKDAFCENVRYVLDNFLTLKQVYDVVYGYQLRQLTKKMEEIITDFGHLSQMIVRNPEGGELNGTAQTLATGTTHTVTAARGILDRFLNPSDRNFLQEMLSHGVLHGVSEQYKTAVMTSRLKKGGNVQRMYLDLEDVLNSMKTNLVNLLANTLHYETWLNNTGYLVIESLKVMEDLKKRNLDILVLFDNLDSIRNSLEKNICQTEDNQGRFSHLRSLEMVRKELEIYEKRAKDYQEAKPDHLIQDEMNDTKTNITESNLISLKEEYDSNLKLPLTETAKTLERSLYDIHSSLLSTFENFQRHYVRDGYFEMQARKLIIFKRPRFSLDGGIVTVYSSQETLWPTNRNLGEFKQVSFICSPNFTGIVEKLIISHVNSLSVLINSRTIFHYSFS